MNRFPSRWHRRKGNPFFTISAMFTNMSKRFNRAILPVISGKAEHRSVSYVRLRLWLENKRLSDESIFLPIQPEILGQDVICQKFSEWEIQFRFGVLSCSTPSPVQCKADISNVVAILQRGIA